MNIVKLNGIRIQVQAPDLDGDGQTGGVEVIQGGYQGLSEVVQPTEVGDTIKNLNDDSINENTRFSKIDLNTRLYNGEIPAMMAVDLLAVFKVIPLSSSRITLSRKRLNVSRGGQGRGEIVSMFQGKKDHEEKTMGGFGDRMKGFMGFSK